MNLLRVAILTVLLALIAGCGDEIVLDPGHEGGDPPVQRWVERDTLVTLSLDTAPFYAALRHGDGEYAGHPNLVDGGLAAAAHGNVIDVTGTVHFTEVVHDYTSSASAIHGAVVSLAPWYDVVSIQSGARSSVPPNYTTPTDHHTIISVPLTGGLARAITVQIDRRGQDVPGYTAILAIEFSMMKIRIRRPAGPGE